MSVIEYVVTGEDPKQAKYITKAFKDLKVGEYFKLYSNNVVGLVYKKIQKHIPVPHSYEYISFCEWNNVAYSMQDNSIAYPCDKDGNMYTVPQPAPTWDDLQVGRWARAKEEDDENIYIRRMEDNKGYMFYFDDGSACDDSGPYGYELLELLPPGYLKIA